MSLAFAIWQFLKDLEICLPQNVAFILPVAIFDTLGAKMCDSLDRPVEVLEGFSNFNFTNNA